jgi:phenylalanyl-tRNA synthetase beta chain
MKVLYKWLKEWIDFPLSPEELASFFDELGVVEVKELRDLGEGLRDKLKVGQIVEIMEHPHSQRLKILKINTGEELVQVVSGAPNVRVGLKVCYAPPGTVLRRGERVETREIMGFKSCGMPLSLEELGLEEKSPGIIELPEDLEIGSSPLKYLGLDDWLYDLYITPNRADLLGVMGIAYELRAHLGGEIKIPPLEVEEDHRDKFPVRIEDKEACPRYTARVVKDVNISPSPPWLRFRLSLLGLRPINNVVDISNFILFELGHPIHVFDLSKLDGGIVVRFANSGEKILTLDGVLRELDENILIIADEKKPVAIAGIMGGEETGVTESGDVLIESAYFNPAIISRGRTRLRMETESSHRFERGADPVMAQIASSRAAYLIREIAGGKAGPIEDINFISLESRTIPLRFSYLSRILGVEIGREEVANIFGRLGFKTEDLGKERILVTVPSRRRDVTIEADLAEEVARIYGYMKIEGRVTSGGLFLGKRVRSKEEELRELISGLGFYEVHGIEFVSEREINAFNFPIDKAVRIKNPLGEPYTHLRPLLSLSLLSIASLNLKRGETELRLFEIGKTYIWRNDAQLPFENKHLAVLVCGEIPPHWTEGSRELDYYDLKGVLDTFSRELGLNFDFRPASHPFLSQGLSLFIDGREIGWIGEFSRGVKKIFDIKGTVFGLELNLEMISLPQKTFRPLAKFPPTKRDLSLLVPLETTYREIEVILEEFKEKRLHDFKVIDVYRGDPLPPDKKNITFSLHFLDPNRTMRDEEVDEIFKGIVEALKRRGFLVRGIDYAT